jgi:hypothetical protein
VTITRVGTNAKFASGWDVAFGGKKAKKAEKPAKTKAAKSTKVKGKKKK